MKSFSVAVLSATLCPQRLVYAAMHQDYSEGWVWNEIDRFPDEGRCGEIVVKRLLSGDRGHYGPLEHPQISFAVGNFPHSVTQQARTHRVGISFDIQSMRYTGQRIVKAAEGHIPIEDVFYLRPPGEYSDRFGKKYLYTQQHRQSDLAWCLESAQRYKSALEAGMAEEHARGVLPFDYRQNFVVSFNLRSLMHFLDLRSKKDAQLEIQQLCDLLLPHFRFWCPAVAEWYCLNRLGKAKLSP